MEEQKKLFQSTENIFNLSHHLVKKNLLQEYKKLNLKELNKLRTMKKNYDL